VRLACPERLCATHPRPRRPFAVAEKMSDGKLLTSIVASTSARNAVRVQGNPAAKGIKYRVTPAMVVQVGGVRIQLVLPQEPVRAAGDSPPGETLSHNDACPPLPAHDRCSDMAARHGKPGMGHFGATLSIRCSLRANMVTG
jgi:hypothetical protein